MLKKCNLSAFTLVELSIVLLIIGLIIGGISAGSSLIQQAKLRKVISEENNLRTAINNFKVQFNALPGDFSSASNFWPSATCPSGTVPSGCNGNADGIIEFGGITDPGEEMYRAPQHLSLAGMLAGTYDGTILSIPSAYTPGLFTIRTGTDFNVTGNKIEFGSPSPGQGWNCGAILTSMQAYNIDQKIDDGVANTGKILSIDGCLSAAYSCSAPYSVAGGANYTNLNSNAVSCRMFNYLE
jgi:type II secretory pathway pseudopilin PulG